ncbi:Sensor protein QseC [Falsiruegeria litorea R37]|uniref:histidine kinase n=1 Tax=Falsiruegeria litorea R37 TaxID=1200284 RepID=A0A1Y5RSX5_9RHOB|nr:ATP-binding protein [Falsiruegeria litorea]SLN24670.1 Sensor protein QseC [Falsiruegeria litorea R37]
MTANRSISLKLSRSLILAMIGIWLAMVTYAMLHANHELVETFDYILLENAIRTLPLASEIAQGNVLPQVVVDVPEIGEFADLAEALDFAVLDANGAVLFHKADVPLPATLEPGFSDTNGARTFVLMDPAGGYGVAVLETAGLRTYTLVEILPSMIIPLLVAVPIMAALAYVLSRKALDPILGFARQIGQRDGRNLSPIQSIDIPTELDPVATEVERLLARVRAALEAERSFSAECAHELRTPLAGALASVQAARGDGTEKQVVLDQVETSLKSLASLAETLLQNSRLQHGFAISDKVIDVVQVMEVVLAEPFFSTFENDRFDVEYPEELKLQVHMDADACAIALRNLMTNALRYSPPNSMVRIRIEGRTFEAINAGQRIPADLLERLGERFTRGNTQTSGTGLGLAITRAVMEDIGGSLELRSPAPNQPDGFSAKLIFPELEPQE